MLIPLIFKNNDTEAVKTKIGRVSSKLARMIYAQNLSSKVGIFKGYGNECSIYQSVVGSLGKTAVTFNKGALSIYGGIVYIEQGTILEVPNVTNGSIGVYVDLSQGAGKEVSFYAGDNPPTDADNLQDNETTGKYYFELYKYTVSGTLFTTTEKTDKFIRSQSELTELLESFDNGTKAVPKASQIVPISESSNNLSFYVGSHLVNLEWY